MVVVVVVVVVVMSCECTTEANNNNDTNTSTTSSSPPFIIIAWVFVCKNKKSFFFLSSNSSLSRNKNQREDLLAMILHFTKSCLFLYAIECISNRDSSCQRVRGTDDRLRFEQLVHFWAIMIYLSM